MGALTVAAVLGLLWMIGLIWATGIVVAFWVGTGEIDMSSPWGLVALVPPAALLVAACVYTFGVVLTWAF